MFNGKKLKCIRMKKDLTIKELADMAGIHWTTLAYYEIGRTKPKAEELWRVARVLGVSMEEFFTERKEERL